MCKFDASASSIHTGPTWADQPAHRRAGIDRARCPDAATRVAVSCWVKHPSVQHLIDERAQGWMLVRVAVATT